jgi:hypothetical protein
VCAVETHSRRAEAGRFLPVLEQITRVTTGTAPYDPTFVREWQAFLRHLGRLIQNGEL